MAIEPVSSISPVYGYTSGIAASRPPEVTPDAREIAQQENDARREAEAVSGASPAYLSGPEGQAYAVGVGTRVSIVPIPSDAEGTLQRAQSLIESAYASGQPSAADANAAAEAYRVEAAARDDLARQRQGNGSRSVDVLA